MNSVQANTRLGRRVDRLKADLPFPVLKNQLSRRTAYQLALLGEPLPPECRDELFRVALELLTTPTRRL